MSVEADANEFGSSRPLRAAVLAAGDVLGLTASIAIALLVSYAVRAGMELEQPKRVLSDDALLALVIVPVATVLWFSTTWGHYVRIKPFWSEARELWKMVLYAGALAMMFTYLTQGDVSRLWLASACSVMLLVLPPCRLASKRLLGAAGRWYVPLIVVGEARGLHESEVAIQSDPTLGYRVAARVEIAQSLALDDALRREIGDSLMALSTRYRYPRLMLAFERESLLDRQQALVDDVAGAFEQVILSRPMQGLPATGAEILAIDKYDTLFLRLPRGGLRPTGRIAKRSVDVCGAGAALALLSPLMLLVTLRLLVDGRPVLYGSTRVGRGGVAFRCLKFRTMAVDADQRLRELLDASSVAREQWRRDFKLRDDPRITPLGRFLRRTSIDELPQLWNVLRGDMSLVGPRPMLPDETAGYGAAGLRTYHSVRPGLTGLWQISGRSDLPYEERVALNRWYVRNWSPWLDLSILLRTLPVLLGRDEAI